MLADLIESLSKPASYRRFAGEKPARAAGYIAFLALVFIGAFGVFVKLNVAPLVNQTFTWLETQMPTLRFAGGQVTSDKPAPLRIEHPQFKDVALYIDTARKEPVDLKTLEEKKVIGYLTNSAFYMKQNGEVQVLDLSKSGSERPMTLDAQAYEEAHRFFDWIAYPFTFLFLFILYAVSIAAFGLIYGLVGMVVAAIAGGELDFGGLFKVAVHAQTASVALGALQMLLPRPIPLSGVLSPALSLGYLWLGVRAAARPAAAPPAA
jgi:hypothetical protein